MAGKHLEIQMSVLCFFSPPYSAPTEPEGEGGQFKHTEKEIVSVQCFKECRVKWTLIKII